MQLRPHQINAINRTYEAIAEGHKKLVIAAVTSFGKTIVSTQLTLDAVNADRKVLFVVSLEPLISQTNEKFWSTGLRPGFIKAGYEEDFDAAVQIASAQTLAQRESWKELNFDLILIDECDTTFFHKACKELMDIYPDAIFIGVTGTPERLGDEQLGDYFDVLIETETPQELTEKGFLAPRRYFIPSSSADVPDLSEVSTVGDDYDPKGLKNACDRNELIVAAVRDYCSNVYGKSFISFCVDVAHAKRVANAFNTAGIPTDFVCGETPADERKKLYAKIRNGELLGLTSVNVLSRGFDEPSVEAGLMLRPTQSKALHFQMIGRVMRISPDTGKTDCYILDQAGNLNRLGYVEDITGFTMPYSKGKEPGEAPTKACPVCSRHHYTFTKECVCGFRWISEANIDDSDMIEVSPGSLVKAEYAKRDFKSFRKQTLLKRQPPTVADTEFGKLYHFAPPISWYEQAIFEGVYTKDSFEFYLNYLVEVAEKVGKDNQWICEQLLLEFKEFAA